MRRPNLFILGAPRCGTTAMFEFLSAHPEIHPARLKEPEFFVPEDQRSPVNEGGLSLEEYLDLFADASTERWLLEASTAYLGTPEAPARIREFSPRSRAIVMVRDPVEQLRSIHDLRVFLRRQQSLDLLTELAGENAEYYWKRVRHGENLARVLGVFPREDVHVVVHDDFMASNESEYRRVLDFLEIDPSFAPSFRPVNRSFEPRNQLIQQALWGKGGPLRAISRVLLPDRARKKAFVMAAHLNRRPKRQPLAPETATYLWRKVEGDIALLSQLLDRDLVALWRR